MCCKCWKEQDEIDRLLFGEMKTPIKPLTQGKHLPQHHQQASLLLLKTLLSIKTLLILTVIHL